MEPICLDVAKGCARNWLGMQVRCAFDRREKQSSPSAMGSGTEQRPLSGRCAKRPGRPPGVNQVGDTGLSYFSVQVGSMEVKNMASVSTLLCF